MFPKNSTLSIEALSEIAISLLGVSYCVASAKVYNDLYDKRDTMYMLVKRQETFSYNIIFNSCDKYMVEMILMRLILLEYPTQLSSINKDALYFTDQDWDAVASFMAKRDNTWQEVIELE